MSRTRSLVTAAVGSTIAFGVVLAGLLMLAAPNAKRPHVHVNVRQAFGGMRIGGVAEFAGKGCTVVWTGYGGSRSWNRATNWAPARVPGSGDTACIPAGKTVVIDREVTVKGIINHGHLIANAAVHAQNVTQG